MTVKGIRNHTVWFIRNSLKVGYGLCRFRIQKQCPKLFIMGCQRSGTTIIMDCLEGDYRTLSYGERCKYNQPKGAELIRMQSPDRIRSRMQFIPVDGIALKPLVESQHAKVWLDTFPEGRIVWCFRRCTDVVSSMRKKWGLPVPRDLIGTMLDESSGLFRSESLSKNSKKLINDYYRQDMSGEDALALFWVIRNELFFEQGLDKHPRVRTLDYDKFVQNPVKVFQQMYDFWGVPFRPNRRLATISSSSVGKGADTNLSAPIRDLCDNMWERLSSSSATSFEV